MRPKAPSPFTPHMLDNHRQHFIAAIVFLLAAMGIPLLNSLLIHSHPGWTESQQYTRIFQAISSLLLFGLPSVAYAVCTGSPTAKKLYLVSVPRADWAYLLIIIIASIPAVNLLSDINLSIHLPGTMQTIEAEIRENHRLNELATERLINIGTPALLITNIITMALIPAFVEEMFFRGWIQTSLSRHINPHLAVIVTAVTFSALHFQPLAFLPRAAFGLIYGYILLRSGSLWLTITAHFVNNAAIVVIAFLNTAYGIAINTETPGTGESWYLSAAGIALLAFAIMQLKPSGGESPHGATDSECR